MTRRVLPLATATVFALAAIGVPAATALAQDEASDAPPTFSVVAPDQSPLGVSYPQWVSRWNQWFLGLPADGHPMMVDDCQAGQQGDAFIVPTTYFGNTLQTTCTVAADQHILVSPGSISCSRDPGDSDEALLACAEDARSEFANLSVTVDGEAIPNIDDFWAVSPITPVELPEGNLFEAPAGTVDIVGGGWYAMLEPLTPGTHTIVVRGETDFPDDDEGLVAAETIATVEVAADGTTVAVVPPGEDPLGVPYGEWAANWWQWLLSTPLAENPGEVDNCQAGQGGEVFYIAHVLPGVTLETSCSVGTDQHILASGGATMYDITECGGTEEGLRACIEADLQAEPAIVSAVSVTVDGQVVPEIESYWVVSPLFDVEYIEDNIYGMEPGTVSQAMIGGWFVMLEPLAPGSHVIEVSDDIDIPDDDQGPLTAKLIASVDVTPDGAAPAATPAADGSASPSPGAS